MKLRLTREVFFKNVDDINLFFNDIPPHELPLQASSSPIPGMRLPGLGMDEARGTRALTQIAVMDL